MGRPLLHLPGGLPRHGAPAQAGSVQGLPSLSPTSDPRFPLSLWSSPTSLPCPRHVQLQWRPQSILQARASMELPGALWGTISSLWMSCRNSVKSSWLS